jgi:hypothetical protein
MFFWQSNGHLHPPRMRWGDWSYPKYELVKLERKEIRARTKCHQRPPTKVEDDQLYRRLLPGRLGGWPATYLKYPKRVKHPV